MIFVVNVDSQDLHFYVPIYLCSGSTVCNLLIPGNIEALVNNLEALYKAIIMSSVMNSSKPFIDSLVKRIMYYKMWIINTIKLIGIILKSKDVGPSSISLSIKPYDQMLQTALTHIVIFYV